MSSGRRVNDRRRRVLYSAHQAADQYSSTAASRSEARRLREARRPQEAYGSRVHRRLRARWFSLVPVRRRAMFAVGGVVVGAAMLLCFAHYVAVSWPSIAYRPEVARPLRLDRPDSFGHCLMVALLSASTGASLLIYQLRRYRNDDFKGHYRLWRLVMIVMVLASINAMVGVMDWGGAILDTLFGKRVALTGSDWIRLVVSLGGAVLAIRLIAEVRRCRSSLGLMITSCLLLTIPEAAKWNVLTVDSLSRWILVTSAPLFACAALFLSLGTYLRMLYREVRQIVDGEPMLERLRQFQARLLQKTEREDDDQDEAKVRVKESNDAAAASDRDQATRRWWQWGSRAPSKQSDTAKQSDTETRDKRRNAVTEEEIDEEELDEQELDEQESVAADNDGDQNADGNRETTTKAKRRWFGLRRAKPDPTEAGSNDQNKNERPSTTAPTDKKKSRFSLRLKPVAASSTPASSRDEPNTEQESDTGSTKKRSSGLGWFRRDRSNAATSAANSSQAASASHRSTANSDSDDDSDLDVDSDDIDWNSLNKTERRRLRKQLKRQNRAA